MMTSEQLHRDVVSFCCTKRIAGHDWPDIEAWVWATYLLYGLSYAHEFTEWIDEAKRRALRQGFRA